MQGLSRMAVRFRRCPTVASIAAPRRCSPELAGLDAPPLMAAASNPDQLLNRIFRFAYEPWSVLPKLYEHFPLFSASSQVTDKAVIMKETQKVKDKHLTATDDGAIYKKKWEECYLMDIADRKETLSDREEQSDHEFWYPDEENYMGHWPCNMMQIFSLRLNKASYSGSPQLYGYMAARDDVDGLLNYFFNRGRDDPAVVQQGSLIEMAGPKRGISMVSEVLIEFDLRIKNGGKEEDDLQLIDGLIHYDHRTWWRPFTDRIKGKCGSVDMHLSLVNDAVEAAIQVDISEVHSAFGLSLTSFVSIMGERQEIQLFHGTVGKSCGLKRVVAAPIDAMIHLRFKEGKKTLVVRANTIVPLLLSRVEVPIDRLSLSKLAYR